jgi:hypothetical protein
VRHQFISPDLLRNAQNVQTPPLPIDQDQTVDEETRPLAAFPSSTSSLLPTLEQGTMPLAAVEGAAIQQPLPQQPPRKDSRLHLLATVLTHLQKPQPEELRTYELPAVNKQASSLGAFPILMLANACGLLAVSFSYYLSVAGYGDVALEGVFLLGLLIMFVPNLVRFLSASPTKLESVCSLCGLGLCFYLVEFMVSPLHFSSFDDFLHWRTVGDILRTGHLFSPNSMLPVSPYYPGLEIVTNAIGSMSGLSAFHAGALVIMASRLLMVLSLFLIFEQLTKATRMTNIAVIVYMANPHFFFFDATYSYETLALPLATFTLYILTRYEITNKDHRLMLCAAWLMLAVVTITHHMTDYTLIGLLILWTVVSLFRPVDRAVRIHLAALALFGLCLALAYAFLVPGNPVWSYLSRYFAGALSELDHIVRGSGSARPLFVSVAKPSPVWDRILMTGSVALVSLSIPFGMYCLWQQYRRNLLAITLGVFSLAYPASQLFRFTQYGSEITDRAAAFLFLSIACFFTIIIAQYWPTWKRSVPVIAFITIALSVIMLGGVVVAVGAEYADLPGPYLVSADMRSIEPEGIQDALWSLHYLGPNNRIGTDRINQMLLSTYGDQRVVTRLYDNVDISPIFYASQLSQDEVGLLRYAGLNYLVVDQRLSQSLPLVGLYFENDTPTKPMSRESLTKFNTVPQLNRIFDSGNIVIYDAGAYFNGQG